MEDDNFATCPKNHILELTHSTMYESDLFTCDNCTKIGIPSTDGVWHCFACKYDICTICRPTIQDLEEE